MWIRPTTDSTTRQPFGEIGTVIVPAPDAFPSWLQMNAAAWDDAAVEGMSATLPIYPALRGVQVEAFLLCSHVETVNFGDVVIRLDVGPRKIEEAPGAPNDAASTRVDSTITISSGAGVGKDVPRYISIGLFSTDLDDVMLLCDISRLGTDGADTFAAPLYVFGAHILAAGA